MLYNILLQIKTINLTILDSIGEDLDDKNITYLQNFDLIVLDFADGGYNIASRKPTFTYALIQYLNEGGALFSGHDQFDDTHSRYITKQAVEMLKLLGFVHVNSHGRAGSVASFNKKAIKNSIFLANYALYGESIPISSTHQTYSRFDESCTTCTVVMKFGGGDGPNDKEYLVTNRPNMKGKTVNIRAGHTNAFTEAEKKIFLSSILWLLYDI